MKAAAYLDPQNAPSDVQIVKQGYGYSQETAEGVACRVIESVGVQKRLNELLEEAMPDEKLSQVGKQLLGAKENIYFKGEVIDRVPALQIRLKVWEDMLKMRGVLNEGIQIDARSITFNTDAVAKLTESLNQIAASVSADRDAEEPNHED